MRRIIVVGCQGSGKSSLAIKLGRKLGLPVVHLDVLYWRPGWQPSETAGFRARVADAVAGDDWVVDGSFAGLAFDLALARADTLIVIDRPRWLCQWRILWRSAFGIRPRPDTARPARRMLRKLDWKLTREAWRYDAQRRPAIEAERLKFGSKVPTVRLAGDREIDDFVDTRPLPGR